MNILIVSNYYYPELGAAPSRITNLAEGLAEKGHCVEVVCPIPNYPKGKVFNEYKGSWTKHENINNIFVHRYWIYPSISMNPVLRILSMFSFAFSLWLFAFRRKTIAKTDVVFVQNSPLLVSMSAIILFKKLFRKKLVLNISDLWPLSALELGAVQKGKFYSFLEWVEKFNYRNSHFIVGQSQEILEHVRKIVHKPDFLYRNLPKTKFDTKPFHQNQKFRIIYAGLLGVAQGVFDLVSHIDFKSFHVEFHIYGHGNEKEKIQNYLKANPDSNVFYHGSLVKSELNKILPGFQASIVPLKNRIHGAVPSKIFELSKAEVPILFCGGGEGAEIVNKYHLGYSSKPGDFIQLAAHIKKMSKLDVESFQQLKENCKKVSYSVFDFNNQLDLLIEQLEKISTRKK